jgi:plasmid stabilization system protein ParE
VKVLGQFPKSARMWRVKDTKEYIISWLPYIAVLYIVQGKVIILNLIHTKKKYPL